MSGSVKQKKPIQCLLFYKEFIASIHFKLVIFASIFKIVARYYKKLLCIKK